MGFKTSTSKDIISLSLDKLEYQVLVVWEKDFFSYKQKNNNEYSPEDDRKYITSWNVVIHEDNASPRHKLCLMVGLGETVDIIVLEGKRMKKI